MFNSASRSATISFVLTEPGNVFAQTEYDFTQAELAISLHEAGEAYVYGTGSLNRNTLIATNLPAGHYILTLYEPSLPDSDSINCVNFSFMLIIESPSASTFSGLLQFPYHPQCILTLMPYSPRI